MKRLIIILLLLGCTIGTNAQIRNPKAIAKRAAENRANRKMDQGINKGLDKVEEGIGSIFKKKNEKSGNDENTDAAREGNIVGQSRIFSDFIPGANIIFADNFEQDALMDFPAQWNSTGSGKVVELSTVPGRWLEVTHNTYVSPVMKKVLPENCTIEFDLFLKSESGRRTPILVFGLTEARDIVKENIYYKNTFYTQISSYNNANTKKVEYGTAFPPLGNKNDFPLSQYSNCVLRVSIALNKERARVYLDQTKIADLPRILTPNLRNNFYFENKKVSPASETAVYISNVRIASADVDARSLLVKQLMKEGKAVTNDILFDVNSSSIKSSSYGIIKQIGEALVQNPSLKIRITGHTDNDGTDAANLELSQKRADAVKLYILENFAIADARIQTDGKGEREPIAPNDTSEGKAKNRRVEFVKL